MTAELAEILPNHNGGDRPGARLADVIPISDAFSSPQTVFETENPFLSLFEGRISSADFDSLVAYNPIERQMVLDALRRQTDAAYSNFWDPELVLGETFEEAVQMRSTENPPVRWGFYLHAHRKIFMQNIAKGITVADVLLPAAETGKPLSEMSEPDWKDDAQLSFDDLTPAPELLPVLEEDLFDLLYKDLRAKTWTAEELDSLRIVFNDEGISSDLRERLTAPAITKIKLLLAGHATMRPAAGDQEGISVLQWDALMYLSGYASNEKPRLTLRVLEGVQRLNTRLDKQAEQGTSVDMLVGAALATLSGKELKQQSRQPFVPEKPQPRTADPIPISSAEVVSDTIEARIRGQLGRLLVGVPEGPMKALASHLTGISGMSAEQMEPACRAIRRKLSIAIVRQRQEQHGKMKNHVMPIEHLMLTRLIGDGNGSLISDVIGAGQIGRDRERPLTAQEVKDLVLSALRKL